MSTNEIKLNGVTLMSVREDSVSEKNLLLNETATNSAGEKIKGELDPVTEEELDEVKEQLNELSDDVYKVSDEEGEIEETDYIPFNDISDVEKPKKKALLSSIIDKIKSAFLSKTWGHVELIQSSDVLAIKDKEVDATASDNNITANHYPSSNKILDNNGKTITSFESIVQTDGTIKAKMYSRNYDTNGNFLGENYITVNKEKSGNSSYGVADKRAFRKAIETIDQEGTKIPANSDLDDYKTAGTYYVEKNTDAGTISNMPLGVAYSGKLIVLDMDSNVRVDQIYITNYNGTGDLVHIYARQISNEGVAKPWREVTAPHTYDIGTEIPSNADLNDYTTAGVYYVLNGTVAHTISNIPNASAGKLIVLDRDTGTRLFQVYVISRSYIYIRDMDNNSVWDEWLKLATTDDITPANVGNGYAEATVSGSAITATITGFKLRAGVIVAIRIVPEISSACTLNINNTGAKSVKFWSNEDVSFGKPIGARITTFIYDGTYYRVISIDRTPYVGNQSYVADTSGNILIDWGYGSNRAQLKYNVGSNKLLWNYYKNSVWRGDVELLDSLNGILADKSLTNIASLDDIPVNTVGKIDFTSDSGLSPLESISIRSFFYTCFAPTSGCKVVTITRYNPTFTDSSSKWERVNNGSGWTSYWVDYTPRGTYVGTCTTAGGTKDKEATVDSDFKLIKGVRVAIKFSNNNTYSNVTTSPITLNVNGTGAKNIWYNTTHSGAGNTGTSNNAYGLANRYNFYMYDGTYWVWDSKGNDDNSTNFLRNDTSSTLTASGQPNLSVKSSTIDITQANNGVTATQYPAYIIQDKNGRDMSRLETVVETNGQIRTFLQVCNYNTSTSAHFRSGIAMYTNKSQDMWYGITNPHYFHRELGFGYGTCDTAGSEQIKVVTMPRFRLTVGGMIAVKFTNTNTFNSQTATPVQLNVNGTGAKNIWYNTTHSGAGNTGTNTRIYGEAGRIFTYVYDGTYWVWVNCGYEADTVDPRPQGFGYGTCTTAEATTAKVVTLASYSLRNGGYVSVKFTNAVPANATMNINSKGAKNIWYRGANITANVIKAGDLATFIYDGTRYQLVANDRWGGKQLTYVMNAGGTLPSILTIDDNNLTVNQCFINIDGNTVSVAMGLKFTSAKTYSSNTLLIHGFPKQAQGIYIFAESSGKNFYLGDNGNLYMRTTNVTAGQVLWLQFTYITNQYT